MPTESKYSLRVLFVTTTKSAGGIERYSIRLAALLRTRGIAVTYACLPNSFLAAQCAEQGIPTVPWRVRNSGDLASAFALRRIIQATQSSIVHIHSRRDYVPAILGARLAGHVRVLLHAHLIRPLGKPPYLASRFFRWGADQIIAVSEAVRERLFLAHGFPANFVFVLPNGVDVTAFGIADGTAQRFAWGIPTHAMVVGILGRLNAKGQSALLDVAPEILARLPETWFVLVGPEGKQGDRERLCAQAEKLGIGSHVVLPGMMEDVPKAMAAFDVLAHLPQDESFGLAPAEAMASGVPVVATDIGGCREVIDAGATGTLVPLGDHHALVSALCSFLEGPEAPKRRRQFGEAGRRRVQEHFSLEAQVDNLAHLYQQMMSEPKRLLSVASVWPRVSFFCAVSVACVLGALTFGSVSLARISHDHYVHNQALHARRHFAVRVALRPNPDVPRR